MQTKNEPTLKSSKSNGREITSSFFANTERPALAHLPGQKPLMNGIMKGEE